MALILEAPNEVYSIQNNKNIKLFLAGGITNCEDWQSKVINDLSKQMNKTKDLFNTDYLTIYNPRRKEYPNDPKAIEEQIVWEYNHLRDADIISFWFSKGSLNPITLYELGRWGNSSKKTVIIGIDPEYERKEDVIIQTKLSREEIIISKNYKHFIIDLWTAIICFSK